MAFFPNSMLICCLWFAGGTKSTHALESSPNVWSWKCVDNNYELGPRCEREIISPNTAAGSLEKCRLTCGPSATLWPEPKKVILGKNVIFLLPASITHTIYSCHDHVCTLLGEAFKNMVETLNKYHPNFDEKTETFLWEGHENSTIAEHKLMIRFSVSGVDEHLSLETDESYTLEASTRETNTSVYITSPTFFGARHALETLSQLIDYDKSRNALQMVDLMSIKDAPTFPYRGVLVDTSRNFFPVKCLKSILDGMSYNKLNYFHWHISDAQAFPLHLNSLPKMSMYGSYSPEEIYTAEQVKDIVQYARVRGIRVIPELDAPSHTANGWQWGEEEGLGKLVVCLNKEPYIKYCAGGPCGQLNIANPNLYGVLEKVYKELVEMFHPIEMFHYGGDEVFLSCWNSSIEITSWMEANNYGLEENSYYKQWGTFQEKARDLVTKVNKGKEVPGIIWTSALTKKGNLESYLDKNKYIIQIWTTAKDPSIKEILEKGYKVIFSNHDALYLDCGVGSFYSNDNNWCSPYKNWQGIYDNDIKSIARNLTGSDQYQSQILGAEVPLWSEQIDPNNVDAKLWPRGSAHAERLWSNPAGNYSTAENRLVHHRQRLVQRGIRADRIQPEWCRQNQGKCRMPWQPEEKETQERKAEEKKSETEGQRKRKQEEIVKAKTHGFHKETEDVYKVRKIYNPYHRISSANRNSNLNNSFCFILNSVLLFRVWAW